MAQTFLSSLQLARLLSGPIKNMTTDLLGRVRKMRFDFDQGAAAGDIGSTVSLVLVSAGETRLYLRDSQIAFSAFGAARTIDIGHTGYKDRDGNDVAADSAAFVNNLDVSGAGVSATTGVVGGAESFLIDSSTETTIVVTVAGGTIPVDATLDGDFSIVRD